MNGKKSPFPYIFIFYVPLRKFSTMRNLCLSLLAMLALATVSARKPADTLSAGRWEFVRNLGQWDRAALFAAKTNCGAVFFERRAFTVTQLHPGQTEANHEAKHTGKPFPHPVVDAASYRVTFLQAASEPTLDGQQPLEHYYNYYLGDDPGTWAAKVPAYRRIEYHGLYDGINLRFLGNFDHLKYEFHIAPGADPRQIRMRYEGLKKATKTGEELLLHTAVDRILELAPYAYQIDGRGDTLPVACSYHLEGFVLTFDLGRYDPALPLVIDPTVVFSSFTGSTADNWGYTATYDSHGNLYGGGIAFSTGYPVTLGAYQIDFCGQVDISVSKFDASGSLLHYSTYLGGSKADIPHSLHVNDNDELYIFGTTGSEDFPVTTGSFDTSFNGGPSTTLSTSMSFPDGADIFVAKLSADGSQLHASTYIGGSDNDGVNTAAGLRKNYADDNRGEIIVDENSNVYIVSSTHSTDFPTTSNCYQTNSSGLQDACVFKMSQDLSTLIWSSYFGGTGNDAGYSMFVTSDKSVYLCGGTTSPDLPVTANPYQATYADSADIPDGFVAHLSANGNFLLHSTYVGKSGYDQAYLIKGDDEDFPHIFGQTAAEGNDWVQNATYYVPGGGQFLAKFSKNLSAPVWSTVFGSGNGGPDISPTALMVDYCENIYLSGWGSHQLNGFGGTSGLPVTSDAFQSSTDGSDFYFMAISDNATNLVYATFFGGNAFNAREHVDGGTSRFDKHGRIYQAVCAGCGGQSSFPTTAGAYATSNGSSNCNLGAIKIDFNMPVVVADFLMPNTVCIPDTVHFLNFSQLISDQTSILWDFGDGTTSTQWSPRHVYLETGYYEVSLIVQDLGSCNSTDTLRKRILALSNTSSSLPLIGICEGDFAELGLPPSTGVTYQWTPTESLSNPNISNPIATPSQTTLYALIASSDACTDTLFQQVALHTLEATAAGDSIVCEGETALLTLHVNSADPYTVTWSDNADFQNIIAEGTDTLSVTPSGPETYYARIETGYCTKIIPVTTKVDLLSISDSPDYLLCFEEHITLGTQVHGGITPYQYQWQLGDGTTFSGEHPHATPPHTTSYTVSITDGIGCTTSDSGTITVREGTFPEPLNAWCDICEVIAFHETTLYSTEYGEHYIYSWTPSQGLSTPNQPATTVTPEETTTYSVTVTDTFGCSRSASVTIKTNPILCGTPFVFIPNSFTPNGDGVNDILYVRSDILESFLFVIYDRWGEKIFETDDQSIGWDGTFKQKDCQRGTYDYYFKGRCKDGEEAELKGNVTLIR